MSGYRIDTLFKPNLMMASMCQDDKYYRQLYPTIIADIEVSVDNFTTLTPLDMLSLLQHTLLSWSGRFALWITQLLINPSVKIVYIHVLYRCKRPLSLT